MILCKKNFSFVFKPVFSFFLMLKKSSKNPVIKKPKIAINKSNNFWEPKLKYIIKRKIKTDYQRRTRRRDGRRNAKQGRD